MVVQPFSEDRRKGMQTDAETLGESVRYNAHRVIEKKVEQPSVLYTSKLYNCCSLIVENDRELVLTHYDDTYEYIDSILENYATDKTKAYMVGGDPHHVVGLLSKLEEYRIPLVGGYLDFYSGNDIDPLHSIPDETYCELLKSSLKEQQFSHIYTNDIYQLNVTSQKHARKDVCLFTYADEIIVTISDDQYQHFVTRK